MNNHKTNIPDQENILHVIKELEQNPRATQRHLSQKLGLSLGKVNFLLNALIDKGIIEAKNFKNSKNKLGYLYLLTPQGLKMKLILIQQFFTYKTQQYERLEREISELKNELDTCINMPYSATPDLSGNSSDDMAVPENIFPAQERVK